MNLKQKGEMSWWHAFEIICKYYLIGIGTFYIILGLMNLILQLNIFGVINIIIGVIALTLGIISKYQSQPPKSRLTLKGLDYMSSKEDIRNMKANKMVEKWR